jgi:SAM-dependent methyltransferase
MNDQVLCICGKVPLRQGFSKNFDALFCPNCRSRHFVSPVGKPIREFCYNQNAGKYSETAYLYGKQLRWAHHKLAVRKWAGRKVLEIGCFNGFFLDELKKRGADVYGYDVNEHALRTGRRIFALEGRLYSSFDDLRREGPFDDILFIDVIEHVDDPVNFLAEMGSMLKVDGRISIAGPTLERGFHDKSDYPPHHKWWFSNTGLNGFLSRSGYKVEEVLTQRDGALFLRNLVGKMFHGLTVREFYGDIGVGPLKVQDPWMEKVYESLAWLGRAAFSAARIPYCSTIIIAVRS